MAVHKKYPALGRGLDALISEEPVKAEGSSSINEIEISSIQVNPDQPRREFDETALQELANSISEIGIVTPITLQKLGNDRYQIIAGERRWRASQIAGKTTIPAYIKEDVSDKSVMEMALVENIQREDLNPIEVALAYQKMIEQYDMTQDRLSERVGKSRPAIANSLRLLKLPAPIQLALQGKQITMGHARALLSVEDPKNQIKLFNECITHGYSVHKVEELAKRLSEGVAVNTKDGKKITPKGAKLPEEYNILKKQLSEFFNSKVQMSCTAKGKGKISISFNNEEDLERIMNIFDSLKSESKQ
ncbi:MAG: ParB/RepB/Spo0J family partition protein [Bacteroidaceae bacterium]|jgi:ParB family chromosome partitioning protein|uniref:ParB/RepB/Spo0J family partition protein n=1 Tax=unclassified Bacteroides TaxID=2646097 RepID=UPI0004E18A71|nr:MULTISPECIES: ParB/RepB/Spo0J family partition protein [unclassified Bacteroides]MBO4598161.1 ParB/RepB/Spo0J family partition protein [Bacteroidaceae bacterium]SDF59584.1 chromosome segregation DNA-binding protein [Bacteroidales bacterium KHT7]MBP3244323.1 ParB/RepB/Spo0J family partition protein [Bacteroidaceae bacterium]MBP5219392.1 ParB/RepB/Spo0J family partition protein [Bacteroidaceae bacterium]MBQ1676982.1 ParB/RepB/Spo0J family partition protein [Bacteroidaceae bacterium]